MKCFLRLLTVSALFLSVDSARGAEPLDADHSAKMGKGLDLFRDRVRPVLLERCFKCHGGQSVESGFDMTDRDKLLKGGDSGAVVAANKSSESLLCKLIAHDKKPFMPHEADKLPATAIEQIATW